MDICEGTQITQNLLSKKENYGRNVNVFKRKYSIKNSLHAALTLICYKLIIRRFIILNKNAMFSTFVNVVRRHGNVTCSNNVIVIKFVFIKVLNGILWVHKL